MQWARVDAGASALLVSALVCLGLLLKRIPSSRLGSRVALLAISDMSGSLLSSLLLLLHGSFVEPVPAAVDSAGIKEPREERCDSRALLFQQAVLLLPLANAFVSLLGFSASLYASACSAAADRQLQSPRALALLLAAGQWLLPAVSAGALRLAAREPARELGLANRTAERLACTLLANFPLETASCSSLALPATVLLPTELHATTADGHSSFPAALSSEELLLSPHPNSSDTSHLLSRIYAIVHQAAAALSEREPAARSFGCSALHEARGRRCLLSASFLRLHLSLFSGLLLFLPILGSALLLLASHRKCRRLQLPCRPGELHSFNRLFQLSALLALALSSPLFLQIVGKTYFCAEPPAWLTEIAFHASSLYAAIRNGLDLSVASKITAAEARASSLKHNAVHPNPFDFDLVRPASAPNS